MSCYGNEIRGSRERKGRRSCMSQPQNERLARWLNGLGAVLIVAGIIGVSLSVARSPRSASYGTAIWGGEGPSTRVAQAGGLYFVMTVTPGPYFLGELLQVDLSLANSSFTTYTLGDSCGGAVYVNRRAEPARTIHYRSCTIVSCPFFPTVLKPGQTLTLHQLLPLPRTGQVTLQPGADFLQSQEAPDGGQELVPGAQSAGWLLAIPHALGGPGGPSGSPDHASAHGNRSAGQRPT